MGCCNSKLPPQTACYHDGSNETPETETSEVMSSDDEAAGSQLVLTLLSASNMPRLDIFSASDIYAVAFLQVDGEPRPPRVTWPVKADATNPVWNSSRLLGCAEEGAVVVVDFYDHDESAAYDVTKLSGSRPDFIGRAVLPVADLPVGGGSVEALLELPRRSLSLSSLRRALQPPGHPPACTLARVAPSMLRGPRRKVVYLIRHGESLWNEAQADKDVYGMLSDVDHPLTAEGRAQAEALAAQLSAAAGATPGGDSLLESTQVLCSPLTRAVQTCLIGLAPLLAGEGPRVRVVTLDPNLREKRNAMGKDSSGKWVGGKLQAGVRTTLRALYDDAPERAAPLCEVRLDLEMVQAKWWLGSRETEASVDARIEELGARLCYSPHNVIAVVGHSHYFRQLFRAQLDERATLDGGDASALTVQKLSNAGVARCEVEFRAEGARITAVQLLPGTELV